MESELDLLRRLEASLRAWLIESSATDRVVIDYLLGKLDERRNPTEQQQKEAYRIWHNENHNPAYRKYEHCRICKGENV